MNKWLFRAVGTVGVASGIWLLGGGAAHAQEATAADPQAMRGIVDGFLSPTSGLTDLGLGAHTPEVLPGLSGITDGLTGGGGAGGILGGLTGSGGPLGSLTNGGGPLGGLTGGGTDGGLLGGLTKGGPLGGLTGGLTGGDALGGIT
ncbi:MAG: hypothetical protein HOV79_33460, partial [Hamadaea sp.]|nr:hypothetical protein [Hamadaea sp.]